MICTKIILYNKYKDSSKRYEEVKEKSDIKYVINFDFTVLKCKNLN